MYYKGSLSETQPDITQAMGNFCSCNIYMRLDKGEVEYFNDRSRYRIIDQDVTISLISMPYHMSVKFFLLQMRIPRGRRMKRQQSTEAVMLK